MRYNEDNDLNNHDNVSTCFGIILTLVYIIVSLNLLIFHLISIVASVLKTGCHLLGIEMPEKM